MKHRLSHHYKRFLLLSCVLIFLFCSCKQKDAGTLSIKSSGQTDSDSEQVSKDALTAYDDFIKGVINAQDLNNAISDGIPELHLRPVTGGSYVIFTYLNNQVTLWHNGPDYESPLNNGAILYERDGGAPTHVNYYYQTLNADGSILSTVNFSKYHSVDQSGQDESPDYDVFIFEEKEVTKDEWNTLTKEYLSVSSDFIEWKEL